MKFYLKQIGKEWKIVRKKLSFMHTKRFFTFSIRWVQFHVGAIPCGCNSTSTIYGILNVNLLRLIITSSRRSGPKRRR